jgi:TolA-binding protein
MRNFRIVFMLMALSMFLVECAPDPKAKIKEIEKKMGADDFKLDDNGKQTATELINAYLDYAEKHKDNPDAPDYLYKAADLSLNINQSRQSLDLYNRIIYQYPDYKKAPECLFLMGYIYENYLQELGKAKEIYEQFIAKYPTHEFADDAKVSIENLGKSPEELIRSFEEKNKGQKDTLST